MQPPSSESELFQRARALSGSSLAELAGLAGVVAPPDLRRAKGFTGQLLERLLGATAGSRDLPDFPELGIELKSLPCNEQGRPVESTFVCTLPLREIADVEWSGSRVCRKLSRVLWIPVQGERARPVSERLIGTPFLWSPSPEESARLAFDWNTLAGRVGRGEIETITGHLGEVLQVRPKAADSRARCRGFDEDGAPLSQMPRGFYLRARFTATLLNRAFGR